MRLGELIAAHGELLDRDELLAPALFHRVQRRGLAESVDGDERRQEAAFGDGELCRVGAVDVDGVKVEAAAIELVADLERGHQILLDRRRVLVVLDLTDLPLDRVQSRAAVFRVERLRTHGEEGRVERQRLMHLEPRDAERHHNICDRVRLRKQIADLGERLDVPFRHIVLLHRLYPAVLKAALFDLALPHGLHDLEAHLRVKPHGNEVEHDVVAAADRLQNARRAADDQLARVAEPHVRAVREAGKTHEGVEVLRLRVNEHLAREARVELGNGDRAGRTEQIVVLKAQHLRRGENAHRIRIVERDRAGVHAGEILEHTDHRRVIVAEHIELEEVILHAVIFKVRGYGVAVLRVGRVLHGAEILDLQIVRHDDQAAGVLARRAAHADAACRQAVDLRRARLDAVFL